jgi:hypothetical protein
MLPEKVRSAGFSLSGGALLIQAHAHGLKPGLPTGEHLRCALAVAGQYLSIDERLTK